MSDVVYWYARNNIVNLDMIFVLFWLFMHSSLVPYPTGLLLTVFPSYMKDINF